MNDLSDRLSLLRQEMVRDGLDAFVIPGRDPHNSEYVPAVWQRRQWISGFTGSNGDVAVTTHKAGLWTDSRYFLQAEAELAGSGIELFRIGQPQCPSLQAWVSAQLSQGQVLGLDPELISCGQVAQWSDEIGLRGATIRWLDQNPIDRLWSGRPEFPTAPMMTQSEANAGESTRHKLSRVRDIMRREGAHGLVVAALDSVAWLCNVRGADVAFNPLVISYALVEMDRAFLFVDPAKESKEIQQHLAPEITTVAYNGFLDQLAERTSEIGVLWLDPVAASHRIAMAASSKCRLLLKSSPITAMKAIKNTTEVDGFVAAQVRDGVAMVRFLRWLNPAVATEQVTELSAAQKLEEFRSASPDYRGPSFNTISGYKEHGAIVHYRVTPETDIALEPEGLYLVDSGGQYPDGTTDITRTVALGPTTPGQRERFTLVLKGHIALITARFPQGTRGIQLDTLARQPLWNKGLDYGHGTGHGIGSYLGVHEGPQSISTSTGYLSTLEPGMFISIEPGYYQTGEYGIRIENLAVVIEDKHPADARPFFRFQSVTYCPIDWRLIEKSLLTPAEISYIDDYHDSVYSKLSPLLSQSERSWLREETRPLANPGGA